jgi:hypothetical protein
LQEDVEANAGEWCPHRRGRGFAVPMMCRWGNLHGTSKRAAEAVNLHLMLRDKALDAHQRLLDAQLNYWKKIQILGFCVRGTWQSQNGNMKREHGGATN